MSRDDLSATHSKLGATTLTDLEVFELSAEACGYQPHTYNSVVFLAKTGSLAFTGWEPFTNAEQRWECIKKLLETMVIEFELDPGDNSCCVWGKEAASEGGFCLDCPAEEFPARALAARTQTATGTAK